jgi:hypothetical protein
MAWEHLNWVGGTDKDIVLREFVEKRSGYAEQPTEPYALPWQINIVYYCDDIVSERKLPDGRKVLIESESPLRKGDAFIKFFCTTRPKNPV